jgi:hypothetical protein
MGERQSGGSCHLLYNRVGKSAFKKSDTLVSLFNRKEKATYT